MLLSAYDGVEFVLTGSCIGEHKADVRLISSNRGNARKVPDVILECDVAIVIGGLLTSHVTYNTIKEASGIKALPVKLLAREVAGKDDIHPGGHVLKLVKSARAVTGVEDDYLVYILSAEETDSRLNAGNDIVGVLVVVYLEGNGVEYLGGILKSELSHQVLTEECALDVYHGCRELYVLRITLYRIDHNHAGHTLGVVSYPLEEVVVFEIGNLLRCSHKVYLRVVVAHVILRDDLGQSAERLVTKYLSGCGIHKSYVRDLGCLGHILVELRFGYSDYLSIVSRLEYLA